MRRRELLNVIRNLSILMVADADEELDRVHMDEAESEVETIDTLRHKARGILKAVTELLELQKEQR